MFKEYVLNNDKKIPAIGFGTWKIWPNKRAQNSVASALENGYRLVDTARIYGNEKGVGKAVIESNIPREEIFVTTKLWNHDQGYDKALKAFDGSLERLGLDYVDLYLIHWPATGKRRDSWRALEEIYQSGRAKAIGVSNYTVKHLEELLSECQVSPMLNQVEFHPFIYEDQKELLAYCTEKGIILEAYSPLAHATRMDDSIITQIANDHGKSNAQVILRWCIQQGTVPLPKSSNQKHIAENFNIFDFELSLPEVTAISSLSDGSRTCWDPSDIQ